MSKLTIHKVIIVGATGVGKSFLLNRLLKKNSFESGFNSQSITKEISYDMANIDTENGETIHLSAHDTPGITDSKMAQSYIDDIMKKMKNENFHQIIIVIQYNRASVDFYNHLEILERCLNGVIDSSVMLIINRIPNRTQLKKAAKTNPAFDLENELEKLKSEINRIFKFQFSAIFNISEEMTDQDEEENEIVLKRIRNLIFHSQPHTFSCAKTWSELVNLVTRSHGTNQGLIELNSQVKSDLKDSIEKLNSNINSKKDFVKLLNRGASVVSGISAAVGFVDRLKILSSVISFGSKSLEEYIKEKNDEIETLKEIKSFKEQKLVDIQVDNVRLNKEIEAFSMEIKRLNNLIKEN
jgi:GTPase Era involved in 16S rRNA processing